MKKVLFIAIVVLMAFNSCKKNGVNLTEKLPELKGEWIWTHTTVGGFVGYVYADQEKPLVIDYKGNNTISVMYNGETIVVDGYINLDDAVDLTEPCLTLYITDKEGHDVGYEGGNDFHFCSGFEPNRIVLF